MKFNKQKLKYTVMFNIMPGSYSFEFLTDKKEDVQKERK